MGTNLPKADAFLVCGLGSLGQSCIAALKSFGATVYAIDLAVVQYWEIPALATQIDGVWLGDCRQASVLEQAHIYNCRAILLVTSDDRVNLSAAFAARALNPNIRLIVRSQQQNLNRLLGHRLGNFIAFEPTQLIASAISLAGLQDETLGFFQLDHRLFRVAQQTITPSHPWCNQRQLYELNTSTRRVLSCTHTENDFPPQFYRWEPQSSVRAGDRIAYLEIADRLISMEDAGFQSLPVRRFRLDLRWGEQALRQALRLRWRSRTQTERVAIVGILSMLTLVVLGTLLYKLHYPEATLQDAINVALVLILGGYDNLFGQLKLPFPIPVWLHFFSLGLTVAGTLFIGIIYAFLTERVFSARINFLQSRPPLPIANHVVLIGLERVGQEVAKLLHELKQPCVGISAENLDANTLPHLPLAVGTIRDALLKVNLATARSVMILTDDEMANLEIGLTVQTINPDCPLVLRTADSQFGDRIAQLLPHAQAFSVDALAAEVFAAAAFGENILSLLHLHRQTVLVTEYRIEEKDTLQGRLIAEVAYGFGVVPILHERSSKESAKLMPSEDIRLEAGDRLVVLATLESLQNIEKGIISPPTWQVRIEKALAPNSIFEGTSILSRISGCELGLAHAGMNCLPGTFDVPLYKPQAQRLVRALGKVQILARIVTRSTEN
ncbi:potassium channel family protein [Altericista sp. CCNU0014]|uniref:potassium channel family protein n=1 Tax=Altericista sp. CCNU0014 TaxID=3082949 RepID=UPI00384EE2AD